MEYQLPFGIVIGLYIIIPLLAQNTDLKPVLAPEVATTYLGGSVIFTCTKADISMETAWKTKLLPMVYKTTNIINDTLDTGVDNINYNDTSVYCFSRYPDKPANLYISNQGKILIQGLLGYFKLNTTKQDSCTVEIYWDPPFTLQGVPILGYNINITNIITGEMFSIFTEYTSIQIQLEYSMNITIAAVNGAGQGNISIVIIDLNEYEEVFKTDRVEIFRKGIKWSVRVWIYDEDLCQNNSYHEMTFKFCNKFNMSECYTTNNISSSRMTNNRTVLASLLYIPENHFYQLKVILYFGNFSLISDNITLSTFDLQEIIDRGSNKGRLCFEIIFVEGSVATGCQIDLYCDCQSLPLSFNITRNYKQFNFLWCSDPIDIGGCVCSLDGYDKRETSVERQNGPAVHLKDITVPAVVSTTLSSSVTPEPTTNIPDNPLSGGGIVGIVMASIVFLIFIVIVVVIGIIFCRKLYRRSAGNNNQRPLIARRSSRISAENKDEVTQV